MLYLAVTNKEIKEVVFSIPNEKSARPDGYSNGFFMAAWDEIGPLVCNAIQEFFTTGQLITECNATNLVVLPKNPHPITAADFRTISCCTVIYRSISRLLCNRLKKVLPTIINPSQGAFVQGKELLYNVLLSQELVQRYNRKNIFPRCLMKINLTKTYDLVHWEFIKEILEALRFPTTFITWIMACLTTTHFTITLNGGGSWTLQRSEGLETRRPLITQRLCNYNRIPVKSSQDSKYYTLI